MFLNQADTKEQEQISCVTLVQFGSGRKWNKLVQVLIWSRNSGGRTVRSLKKSAEKMSQERRPQHKQLTTYSSCAHTFRARAFVWLHHKTITTIWCNWPVIKPIYNRSSSDANEKQMSTQSIRHHIYCCGSYFSHVKCNNLTSKSAHTFTVIPTVPEKNYRTGARFSKKS